MPEKQKKKKYGWLILIGLVLVLAIGGTLAYLSTLTSTRTNEFTFNKDGLAAELYEPLFDGEDWDGVFDIDEHGQKDM